VSLFLSEAIRRWAESGEDMGLEDLAGWVFADCVAQDLNPEPPCQAPPLPVAPPMRIAVIPGR
jgi:hypothetical protein